MEKLSNKIFCLYEYDYIDSGFCKDNCSYWDEETEKCCFLNHIIFKEKENYKMEKANNTIKTIHKQFLYLYNQGLPDHKIGKLLGHSQNYAWRYRTRLGLPVNHGINKNNLHKRHIPDHLLPEFYIFLSNLKLNYKRR